MRSGLWSRRLRVSNRYQQAEGIIDGARIAEDHRDIGIEQHHVATLLVPLVVLPSHRVGEVVLRQWVITVTSS